MTEPEHHEPERDAWLRAALAHAPDAELSAPPALSAAILRAAAGGRTAAAAAPGPWRRLLDAWSWLARPPVAAGFASVMVAGVVGLMWWDRPLQDALPRPPAPMRAESPPADAVMPAAKVDSPAPAGAASQRAAAAAPPAPAPAKPAARPAPRPTERRRKAAQPTPGLAASDDAARLAQRSEQAAVGRTMADEAVAAAPLVSEPATVVVAPSAPLPPPNPPALRERLSDSRASMSALAKAAPVAQAAPSSPVAALLSRWPAEAGLWRWQAPAMAAAQPADTAARTWLQKVEAATRGRWLPAPAAAQAGPVARWWLGDMPLGTLHFEPAGLRWVAPDGSAAFAPLDAAALAALRAF